MNHNDVNQDQKYMVGVLSDTHGYLLNQVMDYLQGVSLIIHAGDLDEAEILEQLSRIAPVSAVRGNVDYGPGLSSLPPTQVDRVGDAFIYTIHDLGMMDLDPAAAGFQVVVYGHYHRPEVKQRKGVLYINPGSTTFPRMGSQKSMALLNIYDEKIKIELVDLD